MENSIYHSKTVYNCLKQLNLCRIFPHTVIKHILAVLLAVFSRGYKGKTVFCIVDDTIASKTKPSSRALHPIEDAYFHQSHLKGKQDYGHQAVAVMLSCNGIVLNYAVVMYNKSISKIEIVKNVNGEEK